MYVKSATCYALIFSATWLPTRPKFCYCSIILLRLETLIPITQCLHSRGASAPQHQSKLNLKATMRPVCWSICSKFVWLKFNSSNSGRSQGVDCQMLNTLKGVWVKRSTGKGSTIKWSTDQRVYGQSVGTVNYFMSPKKWQHRQAVGTISYTQLFPQNINIYLLLYTYYS